MKKNHNGILAASIMCANQMRLEEECDQLLDAGINWLHCDVMDGVFVDNLALFPEYIEALAQKQAFILDIHLATVNPERYIQMFGHIDVDYLTFHIEATNDVNKCIHLIQENEKKVGLAISPQTSIKKIYPYLDKIDLLLMMTVEPGFAGQAFQAHVLEKIEEVKQELLSRNLNPLIEVDGNIYNKTIQWTKKRGADLFVLGTSALFQQEQSYRESVEEITYVLERSN